MTKHLHLKYQCDNEDCPRFKEILSVRSGETAECSECGWFMRAIV